MAGLDTTPDRDSQKEIDDLKQEIDQRLSQNLDARDLWIKYVQAYLEANSITVANATDVNKLSNEIVASAQDIRVAQSIPDLGKLTQVVLQARADGESINIQAAKRLVDIGADPIMMFNGQFIQEATDLEINGAGIDFSFRRTYKNQANFDGPLGARWDHAYNLRLRVVGDTILCSTGTLRDDLYTRHPLFGQAGFNYWVPPDGQHATISEDANSFVVRVPDGTRYFYEPDSTNDITHRIQRIEDKHGNYLDFRYRDQLDGQIGQVDINCPDRFVLFDYNDDGRIDGLSDHIGRTWSYYYDD